MAGAARSALWGESLVFRETPPARAAPGRNRRNSSKLFLFFAKHSLGISKHFLGISKLFFGGFLDFQRVAREKRKKIHIQIFRGFARPEAGFGPGNSRFGTRYRHGSSAFSYPSTNSDYPKSFSADSVVAGKSGLAAGSVRPRPSSRTRSAGDACTPWVGTRASIGRRRGPRNRPAPDPPLPREGERGSARMADR